MSALGLVVLLAGLLACVRFVRRVGAWEMPADELAARRGRRRHSK